MILNSVAFWKRTAAMFVVLFILFFLLPEPGQTDASSLSWTHAKLEACLGKINILVGFICTEPFLIYGLKLVNLIKLF